LHRSRLWTSDWLASYRKEGIDGLKIGQTVEAFPTT
jgi:hypothetical protein